MISKKFYYNKRFRQFFSQFLILFFILAFIFYITSNLIYNLEKRGIKTGFDFLFSTSGFGILFSLIDYNESHTYARTFVVGLLNTILVSVIGIIMASVIGLFVGIGRLSHNWLVRKLTTIYIETFRNLPILLQILLWNTILRNVLPKNNLEILPNVYLSVEQITIPEISPTLFFYLFIFVFIPLVIFGLLSVYRWSEKRLDQTGKTFPFFETLIGTIFSLTVIFFLLDDLLFNFVTPEQGRFDFTRGTAIIPELFSLSIALAVYTATYIAEAVRSGITAVSKGQKEAAHALGLKPFMILKRIVLPQAMRIIIPPTTNQYLNLIKNSSLATAIGYPDLVSVFSGTALNIVGQAVEIMFITMMIYLLISILVSILMNWYNRKIKLIEK